MLKPVKVKIEQIYVPTELRKQLDDSKVDAAAEDLLDEDSQPIQVRKGKGRWVLLKGLHRVEAAKALGEEHIAAIVVAARKH